MKQLKNFLIKREQSQACLSFAKREKSRLLAKKILTLVALLAVTTGAWADEVKYPIVYDFEAAANAFDTDCDIEDATGIRSIDNVQLTIDNSWYTLDGRQLQGKPTQKGIYIYKGKKVKK